jgi:hypothetical protein
MVDMEGLPRVADNSSRLLSFRRTNDAVRVETTIAACFKQYIQFWALHCIAFYYVECECLFILVISRISEPLTNEFKLNLYVHRTICTVPMKFELVSLPLIN